MLKYWNLVYQIGLADWKQVYQFPQMELMIKEIHQRCLCYKLRGPARHISYQQLKKGLQKKQIIIHEQLNLLTF